MDSLVNYEWDTERTNTGGREQMDILTHQMTPMTVHTLRKKKPTEKVIMLMHICPSAERCDHLKCLINMFIPSQR